MCKCLLHIHGMKPQKFETTANMERISVAGNIKFNKNNIVSKLRSQGLRRDSKVFKVAFSTTDSHDVAAVTESIFKLAPGRLSSLSHQNNDPEPNEEPGIRAHSNRIFKFVREKSEVCSQYW